MKLKKAPVLKLQWSTRQPCARCGVYMLMLKRVVQYVGQSVDVDFRVSEHRRQRGIKFDSVRICEVSESRLNAVERELIRKHNPPFNIAHTDHPRKKKIEYYQTTFRLRPHVLGQLQELADGEKRSMNQWMNLTVERLHEAYIKHLYATGARI